MRTRVTSVSTSNNDNGGVVVHRVFKDLIDEPTAPGEVVPPNARRVKIYEGTIQGEAQSKFDEAQSEMYA